MGYRGYHSYRGRNGLRTFLKILIVLLLAILALLVGVWFLLEPHMVYSSDGVRIQLPFLQETEPEIQESAPIVVTTPAVKPSPTPEPEEAFRGLMLPESALYDETAIQQLQQAGATAAIFDMKRDEGMLGYVSSLPLAIQAQVSASDPELNAAIKQFNSGEVYTVARVSCFRDKTVPRTDMSLAIKTNAGNWRDTWDYRWLSPANENARQYVIGVCTELAQLGFDEILLDNCAFPTQGELSWIKQGDNYPSEALTEELTRFFEQLRAALADYPEVKLSVVTTLEVLNGEADRSGQTTDLLTEQADRLFVAAGDEEALPAWKEKTVVPILEQAGDAQISWAVLRAADS